jgi:hypothetical protein
MQGRQIFLGTKIYQINIPNDHKTYQITTQYTK